MTLLKVQLLQKLVDLIVSNNLLSSVIVSSFDPLVPYFMKMKDSRILTGMQNLCHRQI